MSPNSPSSTALTKTENADGPKPSAHVEARAALNDLKGAPAAAGITLPSLRVECPPVDGVHSIGLGSVRPDAVMELSDQTVLTPPAEGGTDPASGGEVHF